MGYTFAFLSILFNGVKGFCVKKTSTVTKNFNDIMLVTCIRMFLCAITGILLTVFTESFSAFVIEQKDFLSIILSAVSITSSVILPLLILKSGACLTLDVFIMLGVIIPLISGQILFNEVVSLKQWLGFGILILAAFILCSYSSNIKEKIKPSLLVMMIFLGVSSGLNDLSQKIFVSNKSETSATVFNMYTYLISFGILLLWYIFFIKNRNTESSSQIDKRLFFYIALMAICLFLGSFFQTAAASYLPSAQLFPLTKSCALIWTTLMAAMFFKERITVKSIIGVALSFIGIMVINM